MNVRISARASDDLDTIFAYLSSRQGTEAAEQFLNRARQAVDFIGEYPDAGPHPQWATRHKRLRFWVISRTNYLIFYFADQYGVSIERILDGRRDVKEIIRKRQG